MELEWEVGIILKMEISLVPIDCRGNLVASYTMHYMRD